MGSDPDIFDHPFADGVARKVAENFCMPLSSTRPCHAYDRLIGPPGFGLAIAGIALRQGPAWRHQPGQRADSPVCGVGRSALILQPPWWPFSWADKLGQGAAPRPLFLCSFDSVCTDMASGKALVTLSGWSMLAAN